MQIRNVHWKNFATSPRIVKTEERESKEMNLNLGQRWHEKCNKWDFISSTLLLLLLPVLKKHFFALWQIFINTHSTIYFIPPYLYTQQRTKKWNFWIQSMRFHVPDAAKRILSIEILFNSIVVAPSCTLVTESYPEENKENKKIPSVSKTNKTKL